MRVDQEPTRKLLSPLLHLDINFFIQNDITYMLTSVSFRLQGGMHTGGIFEHGRVEDKGERRCVGAGSCVTFFLPDLESKGTKKGFILCS